MLRVAAPLLIAALVLPGCAPEKELYVSDSWVRLPAVAGRPAGGYFTIHGGPAPTTLVSVSTDVATRTELHESRMIEGGMSMDALRQVPVPALQDVRFAPGGKHAMLFNLNPAVKPGGTLILTFTFADSTRIQHKARVIAAGDPAPAAR